MGFFSRLFGVGDDPGDIAEIADDVERYADRFDNADDAENAALARGYAERIRKAKTVSDAKALRSEFMALVDRSENSRDRDYDRTSTVRDDRYSDDS